jgi:fatty-acyl-CoA synthase
MIFLAAILGGLVVSGLGRNVVNLIVTNGFTSQNDVQAIEAEMSWEARDVARTMHEFLQRQAEANPSRPALSYQILSGPGDKALTLNWSELLGEVRQAANLFRSLGVGPKDAVAFLLPNALETAVVLLGGMVAGIANPINPLQEPEQISAILRETKAKVVVTLKSFPKSDVAQKVAETISQAPLVKTVLEVDLCRYLSPPKSWIVPLIRPKNPVRHQARVLSLRAEMARQPADRLIFDDPRTDRVAAYFHTGGTTGMPKVAQHKVSGMIYNGWLGHKLLFGPQDTIMCPLPLFHVLAVYPILMSAIASGAQMVLPTPAGYLVTVPTALAALMQRPVDADISTLRGTFSGSAPLPQELYARFEKATGVQVIEGYGLTEATCLVAINPPEGAKRIGSVGLAFPYTHVRILQKTAEGFLECATDEVGEICVANPGVYEGSTYTEVDKNRDLFAEGRFLRTGDLGRIDADGYLYITGRAKDLIIRGGHNIDPAIIEEALMGHPAIAFAGAIGQPDAHAGEVPCAYVELVKDAEISPDALLAYAREHICERAAVPKFIEILPALPKTAVGKVFKPDLRRLAIRRVYDAALADAGIPAHVGQVIEDKKRGLVAQLVKTGPVDEAKVQHMLGGFVTPVEWIS